MSFVPARVRDRAALVWLWVWLVPAAIDLFFFFYVIYFALTGGY
jgi:hypothetical protein